MNTYRRPACVGRRYDLDQVSFLSKTRSSGVNVSCINLTKAFQMIIFVALAMVAISILRSLVAVQLGHFC
ncbi:hypothetical protein A3852_21700 [Rhodococcus qingshengii]|nr:hypothetical protein A3852_21700 [Rhodococcus qingshengii]